MHYNGGNSYLLVNGTEIYKYKAKDSEIMRFHYISETFQKTIPVDRMNKTGFYGYVYGFSVDYNAMAIDDVIDIHKYLMKKHNKK